MSYLQNKGLCAERGRNPQSYVKTVITNYEAKLRKELEAKNKEANKKSLQWAKDAGLIR